MKKSDPPRNPADEFAEIARMMGLDVDEQALAEWRRYLSEPVLVLVCLDLEEDQEP